MVVLVTGGFGQVGQALQAISPLFADIDFVFASSTEADITDPIALQTIFSRLKPAFCINAAAYTAVDKAESEPERAHRINAVGAENLAVACQNNNCVLIHISTDFVFDGQKSSPYLESDQTNPQSVYGRTKLDGENRISASASRYYIIRTSWVYSDFGANFLKTMLRVAAERPTVSVVNDQFGTPTHAIDLAHAIAAIMRQSDAENDRNLFGIYHFSNEGECSWYQFAKRIFEVYNIDVELRPITTTEYPTPAQRPKYSVMDKSKVKNAFGLTIPNWEESLLHYKK